MTVFMEGAAVSVADVAKRAGLTVEEVQAEAAALGLFVGLDWAHQSALSTQDAFVLLDGSGRRNLEHRDAWLAHTRALDDWQNERESVRRQAWQEAHDSEVRRGVASPVAADKGHAAAREAVARFEAATPEPVFAEPESRVQGWLKRVKAAAQ